MLSTILSWVTGPLSAIGEKYVEGRNKAREMALENQAKRDFMRDQMERALLDDDFKRQEMVAQVQRNDRGDHRTSWIRPVTAAMALVFWLALTLSQIVWVGWQGSDALLPVVWHVPPGALGTLFTAFPMGVLASFYIARPFEKFLIGKTGV